MVEAIQDQQETMCTLCDRSIHAEYTTRFVHYIFASQTRNSTATI